MIRRLVMVGVLALSLAGCGSVGDSVSYEVIPPGQVPSRVVVDGTPGISGVSKAVRGYTYAFVTSEAGQAVEVLSVEKAEVGLDVVYHIAASDADTPDTKVVRVWNPLGVPVGFKKVN